MRLEDLGGYQGIKKFAQAKGAFISLTYACQCQCKHCGVSLFVKKNDTLLSTQEIKEKVLDRLKDCGIDVAYFFGGESTIYKDFGAPAEQWLESVDKMLYQAKNSGRNKVCC